MRRRDFIKRAALVSTGLIWVPKHLAAQSPLTADGLADYIAPAAAGGGGGGSDITSNLVALYTLDENAANTTVADTSGNSNTGTASGNTSTLHATGHTGTGAFLLNGTSQYVSLPIAVGTAIGAGPITLAAWFKGTLVQSLIRIQPSGGAYVILGWSTSSPQCIISTDGATSGVAIAGVQDGNWHHVAMTWKKNTTNGFKVYVDGTLSAQRNSANADLPLATTGDVPTIGRYINGSEFMNGSVDDARIYSRALAAADIAALAAL